MRRWDVTKHNVCLPLCCTASNVGCVDCAGWTPLHVAAFMGLQQVCQDRPVGIYRVQVIELVLHACMYGMHVSVCDRVAPIYSDSKRASKEADKQSNKSLRDHVSVILVHLVVTSHFHLS